MFSGPVTARRPSPKARDPEVRTPSESIPISHFAADTKRLRSCTLCLSDFRVVPRFGSHSSLTCCPLRPPGRWQPVVPGHAVSTFPIDAVDCEGHLKGLGNHLPNIHQDAGLGVTAFPCRASARAESCPKRFWAVRKIRCVVCACKG